MAASFRRAAWTFPAAYLVDVAEEAPGFTAWARRNASERYTQTDFVRNNALGFVSTDRRHRRDHAQRAARARDSRTTRSS